MPIQWHKFIPKKLKKLPVGPLEYINKLHVEFHNLQEKSFQKEIARDRLVRQNTVLMKRVSDIEQQVFDLKKKIE